jgi:hypothetical protein
VSASGVLTLQDGGWGPQFLAPMRASSSVARAACRHSLTHPLRRLRPSKAPLKRGRSRATAIQGATCTNDIRGNRLSLGTTTYGWDAVRSTG